MVRLAAAQGQAVGQTNLGVMYMNGQGVAKDDAEAARLYRLAAAQGNAAGQNNLGWMFGNGLGVAKDDAEAVQIFCAIVPPCSSSGGGAWSVQLGYHL